MTGKERKQATMFCEKKYQHPDHVPENQVDDYIKIMARLKHKLMAPDAPAMPLLALNAATGLGRPCAGGREHQDNIGMAGYVSDEWFALIHTPVPMAKALKIPDAKKAVVRNKFEETNGG